MLAYSFDVISIENHSPKVYKIFKKQLYKKSENDVYLCKIEMV